MPSHICQFFLTYINLSIHFYIFFFQYLYAKIYEIKFLLSRIRSLARLNDWRRAISQKALYFTVNTTHHYSYYIITYLPITMFHNKFQSRVPYLKNLYVIFLQSKWAFKRMLSRTFKGCVMNIFLRFLYL